MKTLSPIKIVLFIVLPLLLLIGGAAGVFLSGILGAKPPQTEEQKAQQQAEEDAKKSAGDGKTTLFVDVGPLIINMGNTKGRASFLSVSLSLEVFNADDVPQIKAVLPRVLNALQLQLREVNPEYLQSPSGLIELPSRLMKRLEPVVTPVRLRSVQLRNVSIQ